MMPRTDPLAQISTRRTPQAEQADTRQVPNSAGGFTFTTGKMARLHRFLTLGTDGGTYYTSEQELTKQNAAIVLEWARADAVGLVNEAVKISQAGRAPRNNPALFALAAAASLGDATGRQTALGLLPQVARTGTHLFTFAGYVEQFRGWGRGLRNAIARWYEAKDDADQLAYQLVKYRQREGWTHRDLLRLAHPQHREIFRWATGKDVSIGSVPPLIAAFEEAQAIGTWTPDMPTGTQRRATDRKQAEAWTRLIQENPGLSWEMLPDAALTYAGIWEALIANGMPQTALMRQLPRLTKLGVLAPMSATTAAVAAQLADPERLKAGRVHPVNVLIALRTYAGGHGLRGSMVWAPVAQITDALDAAFYAAYGAVEPAGKRTMLALDVSGSMTQAVSGLPISCREASAALALVTAATEPQHMIAGFTSGGGRGGGYGWRNDSALTQLNISPRQRLDDAIRTVSNLPFGGTDCALPMLWALQNRVEVDHFSIYTDNETWAGSMHPHQALEQYRQQMGINARLSVVGMTAMDFTIADPADPGSMDIAGFDSAVPQLLADFGRGDL
jgi:60 kDa SS-A/Ro ribonucleoprotein